VRQQIAHGQSHACPPSGNCRRITSVRRDVTSEPRELLLPGVHARALITPHAPIIRRCSGYITYFPSIMAKAVLRFRHSMNNGVRSRVAMAHADRSARAALNVLLAQRPPQRPKSPHTDNRALAAVAVTRFRAGLPQTQCSGPGIFAVLANRRLRLRATCSHLVQPPVVPSRALSAPSPSCRPQKHTSPRHPSTPAARTSLGKTARQP